jgi:dolichyl-phosphate beta-glucosyltransferase
MHIFLSIVIPIYNEQYCIEYTLRKIISYMSDKDVNYELILVNDGSKDDTYEVIKKFKNKIVEGKNNINFIVLNNKNNMGKGFSVRKGVLASSGKFILFTDADLSIMIEEEQKLYKYIKDGFDVAIASRELPGSELIGKQNIIREFAGKLFNVLVRQILKLKYRDTQCGFKYFNRKAALLIFPGLQMNDFSFDIEILYLAEKLRLKIKEVPIVWKNNKDSKVNILRDSLKMLLGLIKIKKMYVNFKKC